MFERQVYETTPPEAYGYVPVYDINWDMYENEVIENRAVAYLVSEFEGHTKNILSHKEACAYYIHACGIQGIKCTNADVEEAYTACYGHGCEYEWECA